jgi:hypothetical protein
VGYRGFINPCQICQVRRWILPCEVCSRANTILWGTPPTIKLVLGWVIDSEALTISLPPHRVARLNLTKSQPHSDELVSRNGTKSWENFAPCHLLCQEHATSSVFSTMQNAFKGSTMPLRTFGGCMKTFPPNPLALPNLCHCHLLQRVSTTRLVLVQEESGSQALSSHQEKDLYQPLQLYGDTNGHTASPPS